MKTTLLTIVLALLATPVLARDHQGDHPRGERMIQHLDEQLDLNDEQRSQVEALFKEQFEKRQALRAESKKRMSEILTDGQLAELEQMKAEHKARRQEQREQWQAQDTAQ